MLLKANIFSYFFLNNDPTIFHDFTIPQLCGIFRLEYQMCLLIFVSLSNEDKAYVCVSASVIFLVSNRLDSEGIV